MKITPSAAVRCITFSKRRPRKRQIYKYAENLAIARMAENGHHQCSKLSLMDRLITPVNRDLIADHSYRRVQLFYYKAVVYHNEQCQVALDRTISQVGTGGCSHCSAAHHAILPRIADNSLAVFQDRYMQDPNNQDLLRKLEAIGFSEERLKQAKEDNRLTQLFNSASRDRLISSSSHFQRGLDSTIALPREVNEYDCVIERVMRPKALELLQLVCYGWDPYQATAAFVVSMQQFFQKSYQVTAELRAYEQGLNPGYRLTRRNKPYVRPLGKKTHKKALLDADLEIIRQQSRSTALPARDLLDLGLSVEEQKLLILKG